MKRSTMVTTVRLCIHSGHPVELGEDHCPFHEGECVTALYVPSFDGWSSTMLPPPFQDPAPEPLNDERRLAMWREATKDGPAVIVNQQQMRAMVQREQNLMAEIERLRATVNRLAAPPVPDDREELQRRAEALRAADAAEKPGEGIWAPGPFDDEVLLVERIAQAVGNQATAAAAVYRDTRDSYDEGFADAFDQAEQRVRSFASTPTAPKEAP